MEEKNNENNNEDFEDLQDLYQTIIDFISDLSLIFTSEDEKTDLIIIEFFYKKIDKNKIRKYIIKHVLPHEIQIKNREILFFDENCQHIFAGLPANRVMHYRNVILKEKRISKPYMDTIWEYLDTMIELTKPYL
jgi:hypothetical protein